ncbi:hypothetical protein SAMN06265222_12220 [Neorhodopirellula lusitana]|uniref:Uncharacterized protein n=1 Tax=Neorhodopirellula lusitana TaxID=445327 RepID=A0ABY1QRL2_9BACT|nr:hypothetical protein SAMN06265222_12220 [Neorhodopirellula lusitana]
MKRSQSFVQILPKGLLRLTTRQSPHSASLCDPTAGNRASRRSIWCLAGSCLAPWPHAKPVLNPCCPVLPRWQWPHRIPLDAGAGDLDAGAWESVDVSFRSPRWFQIPAHWLHARTGFVKFLVRLRPLLRGFVFVDDGFVHFLLPLDCLLSLRQLDL